MSGGIVYKQIAEHVEEWRHSSHHPPRKTEGAQEEWSGESHHQQQYGEQYVYHHHLNHHHHHPVGHAYYIHMPSREQYKVRWTWVSNLVSWEQSTSPQETKWDGRFYIMRAFTIHIIDSWVFNDGFSSAQII